MGVTKSIVFLLIVATPIDRAHFTVLLMCTTALALVEIVNITGGSLCRRLQMLGAHRGCALESSSYELALILLVLFLAVYACALSVDLLHRRRPLIITASNGALDIK